VSCRSCQLRQASSSSRIAKTMSTIAVPRLVPPPDPLARRPGVLARRDPRGIQAAPVHPVRAHRRPDPGRRRAGSAHPVAPVRAVGRDVRLGRDRRQQRDPGGTDRPARRGMLFNSVAGPVRLPLG
jgi:hypothetical protein